MSVLIGRSRRFSSRASGNPQAREAKRETEKHLRTPPPPRAYQNLRTGPDISVEYEDNQALPIDASSSLLRSLSPFIIRVEPPFVFANDGAFVGGKDTSPVHTYSNALRSGGGYGSARAALRNSAFIGATFNGGTVEQYVARSAPDPAVYQSGDGAAVVSERGETSHRLGAPAIADMYVAVDIAMQLSTMLNTPPLVLLINPQSLQMNYSKIQQFQDRSRTGYVFHAWGEEQPKLSISARCGAFMSGGRGLHVASKRDSAAWQNLMAAFTFYRNNGYIHDTVGKSNAHHFIGALSIHYDGWIYYGNMETFSFTYDEQNQLGGVVFDMEFVVSVMVDTTKSTSVVTPMRAPTPSLSDPRYSGKANRASNQPGVLSVSDASAGVGRAFVRTLLPDGANGEDGRRSADAVRGNSGFGPVQTVTSTEVTLSERPQPFRV